MCEVVVIDTNVLLSALISKKTDTATVKILNKVLGGLILPLYNVEILKEYDEVLHREKFKIEDEKIALMISAIKKYGVEVCPKKSTEDMIDDSDRIFLDTANYIDNAYLVTGNLKHFPKSAFIVSPSEMIHIIESSE